MSKQIVDKKWREQAAEKKVRDTVTVNRLAGSSRPRFTKCRTEENVDLVNDLVLSQEDTSQTQRTVREISRESDIRVRCYEITTVSLVAAYY